jgi:hypothetical protein
MVSSAQKTSEKEKLIPITVFAWFKKTAINTANKTTSLSGR